MRILRRTFVLALVFTIVASVAASVEAAPVSVCNVDGHCYRNNEAIDFSNTNSWASARDAAIDAGGHLVTITSAEENAFLVANFLTEVNAGAFIGLSQAPGFATEDAGWQWVTGEAYVFTNWNPGAPGADAEPNDGGDLDNVESGVEDFGHFYFSAAGLWNDLPSPFTQPLPFIVEYEPTNGRVPEPGTLTLLAVGVAAAWGWSRRQR